MRKAGTHAGYINAFPPVVRRRLNEMRAMIRKEAPEAEEAIRYGIAAFLLPEGPLVYIAGFKNHVSFFPTSSGVRAFKKELSSYKTSTGTIRFPLDEPLPLGLLGKIVRFRLSELRREKARCSRCDPRLAKVGKDDRIFLRQLRHTGTKLDEHESAQSDCDHHHTGCKKFPGVFLRGRNGGMSLRRL